MPERSRAFTDGGEQTPVGPAKFSLCTGWLEIAAVETLGKWERYPLSVPNERRTETMQVSINPAARDLKDSDERYTPYQNAFPVDAVRELVWPNVLGGDEREWIPQREGVDFKPLCFGVTQGYFVNLLRVRKSGVLSRHYHPSPVHAYVLKGRWFDLEHDWVAEEGSYAMEPPGETHTLIVPEDVTEMVTLFHVTGAYIYVDPRGNAVGIEDVFSKLAQARRHYEQIGLGADYVKRYIR
jgi:2,4'-dihydroxyacetophenone dioxygenase